MGLRTGVIGHYMSHCLNPSICELNLGSTVFGFINQMTRLDGLIANNYAI